MADSPEQEQEAPKGKMGSLIMFAVVGLAAAGGGFAVPYFFPDLLGGESAAAEPEEPTSWAVVPFGETVVNLDEGRLNRYLRVKIALQVDEADVLKLNEDLEKKRAIIKSWLLSYLSDKTMNDIRGAAGMNRLRREIQNHFNTVLDVDGHDRVHEVLFEDFNIQ